jgi:hypothetical protein
MMDTWSYVYIYKIFHFIQDFIGTKGKPRQLVDVLDNRKPAQILSKASRSLTNFSLLL